MDFFPTMVSCANEGSVISLSTNFSGIAPAQQPVEASPMDSRWRRPGQGKISVKFSRRSHTNVSKLTNNTDASSALLRNIQIVTHPSLSLEQDLCLDIPPSPTLSQQTITVTLPSAHHMLTVRPTLEAGSNQRQVKLVALMGLQRLHPAGDASALAYDIQLHPGTTKVDFEAIAGAPRGLRDGPPGSDIDYERVTIFFNLLRGA